MTTDLKDKISTQLNVIKVGCDKTQICPDNLELRSKIADGSVDQRYFELLAQHDELCLTPGYRSCSIYQNFQEQMEIIFSDYRISAQGAQNDRR